MDKKALKILFAAYWSPQGWKSGTDRSASAADFEYAKAQGIMFDPVHRDHDATVDRAIAAVAGCDARAVANAFVWSLSSRELAYRSALGSYAVLAHLRSHAAAPGLRPCGYCGLHGAAPGQHEDLNILNFERFKWGGVRHPDITYAGFDLEQFSRLAPTIPGAEDIQLLRQLLESIASVAPATTASRLQSVLPKTLRSSKSERDILIGILGYCRILGTPAHPGFLREFVAYDRRALPARHFVDMAYPACWWTGADGVHPAAIERWFGHLL